MVRSRQIRKWWAKWLQSQVTLTTQEIHHPEALWLEENVIFIAILENLSQTANLQAFDMRVAVEIAKTKFKELQYLKKANNDGNVFVEVQNRDTTYVAGAGYLSVARIVFSKDAVCHNIAYEVQVLFTNVDSGIVRDPDHFMEICKTISDSSGYKFCPGLQIDHYYAHYYAVIWYHIKSVRVWEHPFKRIDSRNCLLWHELAANAA